MNIMIPGTGALKQLVGDGSCLSAISAVSGAVADVKLAEFDALTFGPFALYGLSTPGHTAVVRRLSFFFVEC